MGNYNLSKILENSKLSENVYDMVIQDRKIAESCKAGQFVELYIDNNKNLLPRPLSICDISKDQGSIRLVYQVLGEGTDYFSNLKSGEKIRLMGPLGNGFTMERRENIAIVGGGVGIPPLMLLLKSLVSESSGANIDVFLGYRDKVFLDNEFKLIRSAYNDINVFVSTDDGSKGFHGNIVSQVKALGKNYDAVYACGPKLMLKAISELAESTGALCQVSCEARMACGFGVCVGCVVKIKSNGGFAYKKVCKDGPVFNGWEVEWDE